MGINSQFTSLWTRVEVYTHKTFIRFLIAGGINTLFGFAVYSLLVLAEAPVWTALMAATIAGTLFNFVTTGGYVFRDLTARRLPKFLVCYTLVFVINLESIDLLLRIEESKILAQAILTLPMAVLSYLIMARFVFTGRRT